MDEMERESSHIHVDLNQRYFNNLVQTAIQLGYKVGPDGLVEYSKAWEIQDITEALPEDERTMNVMVNLANTINPNIILVGDSTSKLATGRIPMLDLAIYMEEIPHEVNTEIGWFRIQVAPVPMSYKLLKIHREGVGLAEVKEVHRLEKLLMEAEEERSAFYSELLEVQEDKAAV